MALAGDIDIRFKCIEVNPNVTRYAFTTPNDYDLIRILSITLQGTGLLDHNDLIFLPNKPKLHVNHYYRKIVWFDELENIIHCENFHSRSSIRINFSVCPQDSACELPYIFKNEYYDLLILGVKASIMTMLNKPWTNLQLGMVYQNKFDLGIRELTGRSLLHKRKGTILMKTERVL